MSNVIINSVATLGAMGVLFGAGLAYASQKFAVEIDPKEGAILEVLPGANCGGCGFPGCGGLASAIAKGEAPINACPVGGAAVAEQVAEIMGVSASAGEKKVARIKCKGSCSVAKEKADYSGIKDCKAAVLANGGQKSCSYGCLGFGTCINVCKFDAIEIIDGIANIDKEKCVACGACLEACPKSIIEFAPYKQQVIVDCSSKDFGKDVKLSCTTGCIGCGICEKTCPFDAIKVENKLAKIDYEKCKQCYQCVVKCPTGAISGDPERTEKVKKAMEAKKAKEAEKKKMEMQKEQTENVNA